MNNKSQRKSKVFSIHNVWAASLALTNLGAMVWVVLQTLKPCSEQASGCPELPWDVVPALVGFGFWGVGLSMWLKQQGRSPAIFFLMVSGALSTGLLSAFGDDNAGRLFYVVLAWLAPTTLHAHLAWVKTTFGRFETLVLLIFYGLALSQSVPLVVWPVAVLRASGWFAIFRSSSRLLLVAGVLVTIAFLVSYYRSVNKQVVRSRVRLVFFGLILGSAPLILLSILPNVLGLPSIPTILNFPWLLLIPLSYSYSFSRRRLVRFEGWLSRGIVYYLTSVFLVSSYLVAYGLLEQFVPGWHTSWMVAGGILGAALLLLVTPLRRIFRYWVSWFFYGGERDAVDLVSRMTNSLALVTDRETLCDQLIDKLVSLLPIQGSLLFLGNEQEGFYYRGGMGTDQWQQIAEGVKLEGGSNLVLRLKQINRPVESDVLRHELGSIPFVGAWLLTETPDTCLWLPLLSGDEMQGLLAIWPKSDKDYFNYEDQRVLFILARQAGITAHNVQLLDELRSGREELASAHRKLLLAQDEERRRLARELHDTDIQQLLGISYMVSDIKFELAKRQADDFDNNALVEKLEITRKEIIGMVGQLRTIINELRPSGLFGDSYAKALEQHVSDILRKQDDKLPKIALKLVEKDFDLPDEVTYCLFQVTREALCNALEHSQATDIFIEERVDENSVIVRIKDNGCGFQVPTRLSELARKDHFGLIGIYEWVNSIGGQCAIQSKPGLGTEILVTIRLVQNRNNDDCKNFVGR